MQTVQIGGAQIKLPLVVLRALMSGVTPDEAHEVYDACDQMLDVDPNVFDVAALKAGLLALMPQAVRGRIQTEQAKGTYKSAPVEWDKSDVDLELLDSLMRKMFVENGPTKRKLQKAMDSLGKKIVQGSGEWTQSAIETAVEVSKGNYSLFIVTDVSERLNGAGGWGKITFEACRSDGAPFIQPELDVINKYPIRLKVNSKKTNPNVPLSDNSLSSVELTYRFNIQNNQTEKQWGKSLEIVPDTGIIIELRVHKPKTSKKR